jgi:hypothetical protein
MARSGGGVTMCLDSGLNGSHCSRRTSLEQQTPPKRSFIASISALGLNGTHSAFVEERTPHIFFKDGKPLFHMLLSWMGNYRLVFHTCNILVNYPGEVLLNTPSSCHGESNMPDRTSSMKDYFQDRLRCLLEQPICNLPGSINF